MKTKEGKLTKKVYSKNANNEWTRLIQDSFHRLEFDTSMKFLKEYLPKKGLILDAGGGPGRYTIELAKKGYEVVLLDYTPSLLEIGKKKIKEAKVENKVRDICEGSITDLSRFPSNSFDSVICLGGPLSHVAPAKNRKKAVSELLRVAKKNAPVFISVMGKFGVLLATPEGWPQITQNKKVIEDLAFKGEDYEWVDKGYCHFFTLKELENIIPEKKAKIIERVGLEGLNFSEKTTNDFAKKYPKGWKNWLDIHYKICTHPTVVDLSGHIMVVLKKK